MIESLFDPWTLRILAAIGVVAAAAVGYRTRSGAVGTEVRVPSTNDQITTAGDRVAAAIDDFHKSFSKESERNRAALEKLASSHNEFVVIFRERKSR